MEKPRDGSWSVIAQNFMARNLRELRNFDRVLILNWYGTNLQKRDERERRLKMVENIGAPPREKAKHGKKMVERENVYKVREVVGYRSIN